MSSVAPQDTVTDGPQEEAAISKFVSSDGYDLEIKDLPDGRQIYDLTIWDDATPAEISEVWSMIPDDASKIDGFDYAEGRIGSVYIYEFSGTA